MSAPETNLKKQKRRHWPSLIGIAVAVGLAIAAASFFGIWDGASDDAPTVPPASEAN